MRYDHHPDPAIAFCVEVEGLEGETYDLSVGIGDAKDVERRVERALEFRVGGDAGAVAAKARLRDIDAAIKGRISFAELFNGRKPR